MKLKPIHYILFTLYFVLCVVQLSFIPVCAIQSPYSEVGCSVVGIGGIIITSINVFGIMIYLIQSLTMKKQQPILRRV